MTVKNLSVDLQKANSGQWVLSACTPDRVQDTIAPEAYLDAIKKLGNKLICLWQHDPDRPIGKWENLKADGKRLIGDLHIADTNLGKMVKQLISEDIPLGASIGFKGIDGEMNDEGGVEFKEIELLETSIVSIPCHPEAYQIAKSFGVDLSPADEPNLSQSAAQTTKSTPNEGKKMNLAEKIKSVMDELVGMRDNLVQLNEQMEEKTGDELEETRIAIDELQDQIVVKEADLTRLEKSQDLLKSKAKPVGEGEEKAKARATGRVESKAHSVGSAPAVATDLSRHNKAMRDAEDTPLYIKHAVAKFISHCKHEPLERVINRLYGEDRGVKEYMGHVTKSAIDIATTTDTTWASALVRQDQGQFVASLRDTSVVGALIPYSTQYNFNGQNEIKIPVQGALPPTPTEPAFVAEGRPIPLMDGSISSVTMKRVKVAGISTFSQELADQSTPQIEGIIRELLMAQGARMLDQAFLTNAAAVAEVRPDGIRESVTGLTPTPGGGEASVRGDIVAMVSAMATNRVGTRPVWVMNSISKIQASLMTDALGNYPYKDELGQDMLAGIPVIHSMSVPVNELYLIDAALLATAIDVPTYDVSTVASIIEASADTTAPTMDSTTADGNLVAAGGTPGDVRPDQGLMIAGQTAGTGTVNMTGRSLWQTASVGVRMIQPVGWARLRGADGVQYTPNITWGT